MQSSLTDYARKLDAPTGTYAPPSPNGGFKTNDNVNPVQAASIFYGGKVYGNLGAFVQTTFTNAYTRNVSLDSADIRYADTAKIGSLDFVYGVNGEQLSDRAGRLEYYAGVALPRHKFGFRPFASDQYDD